MAVFGGGGRVRECWLWWLLGIEFAGADKGARVGSDPLAHHVGSRVPSCGKHEFLEFTGILPLGFAVEIQVDEHGPLP